MIYIVIYFFGGLLCNFVRGYIAPVASMQEHWINSYILGLFWPVAAPLMFRSFGVIVRSGEKQ